MTGKELGDNAITRDHDGESIGFCSEDCAKKWDGMSADERTKKLAAKNADGTSEGHETNGK